MRQSPLVTALAMSVLSAATMFATPAQAKAYKGAEVYSNTSVKYGRFEVRMRVARGSGLLSTFFLYKNGSEVPGTFWEEIDIEVFGKDNAMSWQSNLITSPSKKMSEKVHPTATSLAEAYHTYAIEWRPDSVTWFLDGSEVHKTTGGQATELTNPESLHFNLWAADSVSWVGPVDDSAMPASQFVNWIRYSRLEGTEFVPEWTDDFDSFDTSRWSKASWTFGGNLVDFDPLNATVKDGTLVLTLSQGTATGFTGAVPVDPEGGAGGGDGTGGTADGGATHGGATHGGAGTAGTSNGGNAAGGAVNGGTNAGFGGDSTTGTESPGAEPANPPTEDGGCSVGVGGAVPGAVIALLALTYGNRRRRKPQHRDR